MAVKTDDAAARPHRGEACSACFVFDPAANAAGKSLISRPERRVAVLVVPTDEELMIAQHTLAFLPKHTAKSGMLLGMQQQ
jgi:hypothetical protein